MLYLPEDLQKKINTAVLKLDHWLDTMRQPGGYGGPISHWWESSLIYCGPMVDWRYEGILCGYVQLFRKFREPRWLQKAWSYGTISYTGLTVASNYNEGVRMSGNNQDVKGCYL